MKLYTAQYRYAGEDRLDITAKGKGRASKAFAPSWKMVMGSKNGQISWDDYQAMYRKRMQTSYQTNREIWDQVLSRAEVTFVCFCKPGSSCHRYLLAQYFETLGAEYAGERSMVPVITQKESF